MAYGDYGGFAYRNGVLAMDRSDAVIGGEGGIKSSPGTYPGFVFRDDVMSGPYHVLLGDGPVMVALHKQGAVLLVGGARREFSDLLADPLPDAVQEGGYLDLLVYEREDVPVVVEVDGHRVEVRTEDDGMYVHARLAHPDGTTWHGWSGYGVGAGHEDPGRGSSADRDDTMRTFWPDAPSSDA